MRIPNQHFPLAKPTTPEQKAAAASTDPGPLAPEVIHLADVELTITKSGWLKFRDHRGINRKIEMTNDYQTLIDTLVRGSGATPVETVRTSPTVAVPSNLRYAGQGEVQTPHAEGTIPANKGPAVPLG